MRVRIFLLIISTFLISFSLPLFGENVQISAAVEKNTLSVGESFIYQIQIKGSDKVSAYPEDKWNDINFSKDFSVDFLGGQNNSSRQITIINGKRAETVNSGYFLSWRLTPHVTGILTIPSVSVTVDGNTYSTKAMSVEVSEAEQSSDFKLLVSLDKDVSYVGEPLLLTFTWYIGTNVKDFSYSIPFFKNKYFRFEDTSGANPDPSTVVRFPVDGASITAIQGKGTLNGNSFTTLTFSKIVIPKTSGNYTIPESVISVSAQAPNGAGTSDFFNSFFSSVSPEYSQFTVPSNPLSLKVLDLPEKGKPDNFDGYVGELNIETTASPLEVRVGDPITLTIKISGPKNIAAWEAPKLQEQSELVANFKMPSEMSAGKIEGESVIFTQTIRALNDKVAQIPALKIPYFDTKKGVYSIAKSRVIPITVQKGAVLQIEGFSNSTANNIQPGAKPQKLLQTSRNGINFNYENIGILENKGYGLKTLLNFPLILLLVIPPLFFLFALMIMLFQKRKSFSEKTSRKNALAILKRELKGFENSSKLLTHNTPSNIEPDNFGGEIKTIFQNFLARKMNGMGGYITEEDVRYWLQKKGFSINEFPLILEVFTNLDELQFAGSFIPVKDRLLEIKTIMDKIYKAAEELDWRIQK